MSLVNCANWICHFVCKVFQVCNKVSITLPTKPFTILKYLSNTIYLISTNCLLLPVHVMRQPSSEEWQIAVGQWSFEDVCCVVKPLAWVFFATCWMVTLWSTYRTFLDNPMYKSMIWTYMKHIYNYIIECCWSYIQTTTLKIFIVKK
jgi:hypothetical protein